MADKNASHTVQNKTVNEICMYIHMYIYVYIHDACNIYLIAEKTTQTPSESKKLLVNR